ncbi:MAG: hypothetical protein ACLR56_08480 [Oscillospiraceae bacterium]
MPLRVVNGKKLERRRKTGMFFSVALIIALILTVFQLVLPAGITENTENLISLIGKGSYPISLESTETQSAVSAVVLLCFNGHTPKRLCKRRKGDIRILTALKTP